MEIDKQLLDIIKNHQVYYDKKNEYVSQFKTATEDKEDIQSLIDQQLEILKQNEELFEKLNMLQLQKFNISNQTFMDYPKFLTPLWRKLVHNQCDQLQLEHPTLGKDKKNKFIQVKKKPKQKEQVIQENSNQDEYNLEPEMVEKIDNVHLIAEQKQLFLQFEIDPPEFYGQEIIFYSIYINNQKTSDSLNNKIKILLEGERITFQLTASNFYGESEMSQEWNFQFNQINSFNGYFSGNNKFGQVGINSNLEDEALTNPIIDQFTNLQSLNGMLNDFQSFNSSLILCNDGSLAQFGATYYSDDENLNEVTQDQINQIELISSEIFQPTPKIQFKQISVGQEFCSGLSIDGKIYTWGNNVFGQLGLGDRNYRLQPTLVNQLKKEFITQICGSYYHMLCLNQFGKVYCWGRRQACGGNPIKDRFGNIKDFQNVGIDELFPRLIKEVIDYFKVKKIDCGEYHNACITFENDLYMWGDNNYGQLGILNNVNSDQTLISTTIPKKIISNVQKISCGKDFNLAIINNQLYSWGKNNFNQCIDRNQQVILEPQLVQKFQNSKIDQISAGDKHCLITVQEKHQKQLFAFGNDKNGSIPKCLQNQLSQNVNNNCKIFAGKNISILLSQE